MALFVDLVHEAWSVCGITHASMDFTTFTLCGNADCKRDTTPEGSRLLLCSACQLVRYCSPGCQLMHWHSIHKHDCHAVLCVLQTSPSRLEWLRALAGYTVRQAAKQYASAIHQAEKLIELSDSNPEDLTPLELHQNKATFHMWVASSFLEPVQPLLIEVLEWYKNNRGEDCKVWETFPRAPFRFVLICDNALVHANQYVYHALHGHRQDQVDGAQLFLRNFTAMRDVWNQFRSFVLVHAPVELRYILLNVLID